MVASFNEELDLLLETEIMLAIELGKMWCVSSSIISWSYPRKQTHKKSHE